MKKIKVGLRRLYDAMGCSISSQREWTSSFPVDCFSAIVYIGPDPKFGIEYNQIQTPKYQVPGEMTPMASFEYKKISSDSTYPRKFFTEIVVFKEIEVSDEVNNEIIHGDSTSVDKILGKTAEYGSQIKKMIDVIAGALGLRYHCQFVMEIISDMYLVMKNEDDWGFRFSSPGIQLLESLSLNDIGIQSLDKLLPEIGRSPIKAIDLAAKAFEWLLKAWIEQESVSKFVFLFIAIEVVLGQVKKDSEKLSENASRIRTLIENYGGETKDADLKYFEKARRATEQQPFSLVERFENLAEEAKLVGWENDIQAFRKFNRFRNNLVHGGDSKA